MKILTSLKFYFKPESDVIIPPYSSKLSRSIVLKILEEYKLTNLVNRIRKPEARKPYIFTVVFQGDKPLYKSASSNLKFLMLKSNKVYWFKFVAVGGEEVREIIKALTFKECVDVYGTGFCVVGIEAEVIDFKEINFDGSSKYIHMKFITPALLQLPRPKKLREKIGLRHSLFPIPSLIIYSLAKHWNSNAPENIKIPNIIKLAKISDYILTEVDHYIKPETVIYDEKRKPRGFVGWVLYKLNKKVSEKSYEIIMKLLKYANYVGIGRSRTIGFGTTQITQK